MSADILIHRCTLRLARRGGWSWGADPRALLNAAVQGLPALVAARLGELWPAGQDCELAAPVRLRLPLRLDELREFAAGQAAGAGSEAAQAGALAQRIDLLVRELVLREAGGGHTQAQAPAVAQPEPVEAAPDIHASWARNVLSVLLAWLRQGTLESYLLTFAEPSLASWHENLLQLAPPVSPASAALPPDAGALAAMAERHALMPLPLPAGRVASLVRRLALMAAAADALGVAPGDTLLLQALKAHRAFDLPAALGSADPAPGRARAAAAPGGVAPLPSPAVATAHSHAGAAAPASASARSRFDVKVASALPFLLLGPLSRTGYLRALGAVFEAAQLQPRLPCFAVALARKVLEPPHRGWFRRAEAQTAAAAFAGQVAPAADPDIADLARRLEPLVSPLDAVVANVLTAGHRDGAALVLQAAPLNGVPGWILCDEDGLFPIAWASRVERLYARLAAMGGELLLVPEAALAGTLLDDLDDAGFRFVTDACPARGRPWRALHHGPLRGWTNEATAPAAPLARAVARLDAAGGASADLWQALATQRPALPAGTAPAVERSLALAAALALGTLAWSLWHGRETVSPLLALQRFADLDAHVSVRPDRVMVQLPLGRRFFDLKRAGWLDDVADVPWLDGRPLLFAQG